MRDVLALPLNPDVVASVKSPAQYRRAWREKLCREVRGNVETYRAMLRGEEPRYRPHMKGGQVDLAEHALTRVRSAWQERRRVSRDA